MAQVDEPTQAVFSALARLSPEQEVQLSCPGLAVTEAPTHEVHEADPLELKEPGGHGDIIPSTHLDPAVQASEVQEAKVLEAVEKVYLPLSQSIQSV